MRDLLAASGFQIHEQQPSAGREPVNKPIPPNLHTRVQEALHKQVGSQLYSHQAAAIEASLRGQDVCVATSTASGKSLIFMAVAAHLLSSDKTARILVFYPAKALIQDQLAKWRAFLAPLGETPAFIDGSLSMLDRMVNIVMHRVILMTPDVCHAWLMSRVAERAIAEFRQAIQLVVLDEAHVYDGVFGTNMAFFLRRLQSVLSTHRLIVSTATLGDPAEFTRKLTGRTVVAFRTEEDGARAARREFLLVRPEGKKTFQATVDLLRTLGSSGQHRFMAFADSRKMVERLAAVVRWQQEAAAAKPEAEDESVTGGSSVPSEEDKVEFTGLLPYRAGLEEQDRRRIQEALGEGSLRGVVATSALEMGVDIGEIDLVILLKTPPSMKAFWQRAGRAGRRNPGTVILIDDQGLVVGRPGGLYHYLHRPLEPNWLYLDNRVIQYAHALCAASEQVAAGGSASSPLFETLPTAFSKMLKNEVDPEEMVPSDLYALKQRAQAGPHYEFPLRSAVEQQFDISTTQGQPLGTLTFSQTLREAYPGAIYLYMARAYRVLTFDYRKGAITVCREKSGSTEPTSQITAFPDFLNSTLRLLRSESGFVAEVDLQVSERVTGFSEKRGQSKQEFVYGPGSPFYQQPLHRFIRTTGVCWFFTEQGTLSDRVGESVLRAFCSEHGIQSRDVGLCRFHAKKNPLRDEICNGLALFDNTNGSLRLTERLAADFPSVARVALQMAENDSDKDGTLILQLRQLAAHAEKLTLAQSTIQKPWSLDTAPAEDWVKVIAPQQKAIYTDSAGSREVTVVAFRYTPKGPRYHLFHPAESVSWTVECDADTPLNGETIMQLLNVMTGETNDG